MVSGSKVEGSSQILSAGVRKTIQQIKEIVGNHSDADIYVALKETNMDPNETTQKLLNQDPFHEVKRKKDRKKEIIGYRGSTAAEPHRNFEHVGQTVKSSTYSDRNVRRIGYGRNALPDAGVSREFRVVRDNRVNQNANKESKPVESSISSSELGVTNVSAKSNQAGISIHQKPPFGHQAFQALNGSTGSQSRQSKDGNPVIGVKKDLSGVAQQTVLNSATQMQAVKPSDSQLPSTASSSNSVVGVYSSSSDPVHVPSPDSRSAAKVGAIKREVGVVGANRQNSDPSTKLSSSHSGSFSSTNLGREGSSREALRSVGTLTKAEQLSQNTAPESALTSLSVSRSFSNNQQSSRSHQLIGHQKAPQPNKEWKPKSSQKSSANGPGVIGMPKKAAPPVENSKDVGTELSQLEDKMSRVNMFENQNVIIAAHIRVSDTDRCQLTFGSLGADFETRKSGYQVSGSAEEPHKEPSGCLPVSSGSESSSNEATGSKQIDLIDDHVRNSGSGSPASVSVSDHQLNGKREGSSPENLDNFADIGLVQDDSPPYVPPESQQPQDTSELQSFSAYDPQTGYEISYFRPTVDEHVRGQGLPSPQEALSSHPANSIPSSSMAMLQQQQQQQQAVAQMYPQLHVSPFANLMPYRQFMSPLYVPPMAVPGYSSNAAYPHPSNGSSYVLMPGSSSHLTASGLKYGIQQFKPVPAGSPTGFGNFTSPTGYAVSTPGVVGSATGLEDTSRFKYKDGNLYVPNPQAETSEIWMNPRDLQSAAYYNMPGQTPHAAYLPSHSGHSSFNGAAAAVAQSSHMQFPGLYHAPLQPGAMGNPHHLGPAMGGNVGAATPGAQVGAYQQPQLGHISWTGNF